MNFLRSKANKPKKSEHAKPLVVRSSKKDTPSKEMEPRLSNMDPAEKMSHLATKQEYWAKGAPLTNSQQSQPPQGPPQAPPMRPPPQVAPMQGYQQNQQQAAQMSLPVPQQSYYGQPQPYGYASWQQPPSFMPPQRY